MKRNCMALALMLLLALALSMTAWAEGYIENSIGVRLDYNDGVSRPHIVYIAQGGAMEEPALPLRTGYSLTGWQNAANELVTFPYTPSGSETLTAVWEAAKFTVTFDMNMEGLESVTLKADFGETVSAPETPEVENYSFFAWQSAPQDGAAIEFPYTVTGDVTFYASWAEGDLTIVSFNLNYEGAEAIDAIILGDGEKLTKKAAPSPERANYRFSGWSETPDGKVVKYPYKTDKSVTLYAIWERDGYKVAFRNEYTDNPTVVFMSLTVDGGDAVEEPTDIPVREGYEFIGWYTAASGGEAVSFPYTPTGNSALYAHWKHLPVVTDIFQAEYVSIEPNETFPGYSGEARGTGIIAPVTTETGLIVDEDTPLTSKYPTRIGNYITYLYKPDATLEFVITASEATTATLKANLSIEMQPNWTFAPTGDSAYKVYVNDVELDYGTITFASGEAADLTYKAPFQEFTLGQISLNAGENVIRFVTANNNTAFGGTMKAVAPMVDCIMLEGYSGELSWSPVYDNIN